MERELMEKLGLNEIWKQINLKIVEIDWNKKKRMYLNFIGIKIRNHWDWAESINKALNVVIAVKYACN